ncbi:MAG TPA: nuclear transport factor 2 family protein [Acidimicrobiales bacterium]|nr:nuclear transport factor 2 family protein [Acidimicrobiales bacterium]
MHPEDLVELELIKRLKYRYARCLDLKLFDEVGELFTADATASYGGGAYTFDGRDAIVDFLRRSMSSTAMLTSHKMHNPEIDLTGPTTATGIWSLDDVVVLSDMSLTVRGAAFYDDQYVKVDGRWCIAHTGYKRVYEELAPRPPDITLTASYWGTDGRSSLPAG